MSANDAPPNLTDPSQGCVPREVTQARLDRRAAASALIKPGDLYTLADRVEEMARRGIDFMTTPKSYFDDLPRRLEELKITNVTQDLKELERLHILLDGGNDKYMLQIFLKEAAVLYGEQKAGPFFYEIIQRAGDPGFGYGNFSALFRSIERAQKAKDLAQRNPAGAA